MLMRKTVQEILIANELEQRAWIHAETEPRQLQEYITKALLALILKSMNMRERQSKFSLPNLPSGRVKDWSVKLTSLSNKRIGL